MALFGRKKPQELYAEAKKLTDLVYDWLLQPLRQYNFSVSDGVQTEYYLLAICSYLAQEKISPAAREHLHTAVVESSTYGKKYVKDKQKEYGFMAVLFSTFKTEERDARRAKGNVLSALVTCCFRDFSKYEDPDKVKRCVHSTINLFNQEIPTTDYAKLRLPVPAAAPARSDTAPTRERQTPSAGYVLRDEKNNPVYYNKLGDPVCFEGERYQLAQKQDEQDRMICLKVTGDQAVLITDRLLMTKVFGQYMMRATQNKLMSDRPDHFDLRSSVNGQQRRANVVGWVDEDGKHYALTRWADGNGGVLVLEWNQNSGVRGIETAEAERIFAIFREQNSYMFQ